MDRTFLGLTICVLVVASLIAFIPEDSEGDNGIIRDHILFLDYRITSDKDLTVEVVKWDNDIRYTEENPLRIPSTVEYNGRTYTVTGIDKNAFEGRQYLESIVLPDTLKYIGYRAFSATIGGNPGLKSIYIPDSVTYVGVQAFFECDNLTEVRLSPNAQTYAASFSGCSKLQYVEVPEGIRSLQGTFGSCENLETVILPSTLEEMYSYDSYGVFSGCKQLRSLYLPENARYIGWNNCFDTSGLESIEVSDKNPYYKSENGLILSKDGKAVVYCPPIVRNADVPEGVESIGSFYESAKPFMYCEILESVRLPSTLKRIGDSAFQYCYALTEVIIPDAVTEIGYSAFNTCKGLNRVVLPENLKSIGGAAFSSCESLDGVVIPYGVETVGDMAFESCISLTNLELPDSVTSLGHSIFEGCIKLRGARLPDGILEIKEDMFKHCYSLRSIVVPEGVMSIGTTAFYGCNSLTSIEFPNTLQELKNNVFEVVKFHKDGSEFTGITSNVDKLRGRTFVGDCWNMYDRAPSYPGEYGICFMVEGSNYHAYSAKTGEVIVPPASPVKIDGNKEYPFIHWKASDGTVLEDSTHATRDVVFSAVFSGTYTVKETYVNFVVKDSITSVQVPSDVYVYEKAPAVDKIIVTDSGKTYMFLGWFDSGGVSYEWKKGSYCSGRNVTLYPWYEEIGYNGDFIVDSFNDDDNYVLTPSKASELSSEEKGLLIRSIPSAEHAKYHIYLAIPSDVIPALAGKETIISMSSSVVSGIKWEAEVSVTQDGSNVSGLDDRLSFLCARSAKPEDTKAGTVFELIGGKMTALLVVNQTIANKGMTGYSVVDGKYKAVDVKNYNRFSDMKAGPGKWELYAYTQNYGTAYNTSYYVVTLLVDGRIHATIQTGDKGLVYLPDGPLKPNEGNTHYVFDKWVYAYDQEKEFSSSELDGYVKLVAKYTTVEKSPEGRYISFDSDGGYGKMDTVFVPKGTSFTLPENTFRKAGYQFMGWTSNSNDYADGAVVSASDSTDNITLKAKWGEPRTYQLKVVYTGPVGDGKFEELAPADYTKTLKVGESHTISVPDLTNPHYLGAKKSITVTMPAHDRTVYVFYKSELLSLEINGYDGVIRYRSYSSEVDLTKYAVNEDYTYKFYSDEDKTNPITKIGKFSLTEIVYAERTLKPRTYTISFDGNGADSGSMEPVTQDRGVFYTLPSTSGFSRDNYEFMYWSGSINGDKVSRESVYGNKVYYAIWKYKYDEHPVDDTSPIDWNIRYYTNKGNNSADSIPDHLYTESVTYREPTRKGFVFQGWYAEPELITPVTGIDIHKTGNTRVYASWMRIGGPIVTVHFTGPNDGVFEAPDDIVYSTGMSGTYKIEVPKVEGYNAQTHVMGVIGTADLEFTVEYKANIHKVRVKSDVPISSGAEGWMLQESGVWMKRFAYADPLELPEFKKVGHKMGWDKVLPERMGNEDMEFETTWTLIQYDITFLIPNPDYEGGKYPGKDGGEYDKGPKGSSHTAVTVRYDHGERIDSKMPSLPSRSDYVILWYPGIPELALEKETYRGEWEPAGTHTLTVKLLDEKSVIKTYIRTLKTGEQHVIDPSSYPVDREGWTFKPVTITMPSRDNTVDIYCHTVKYTVTFMSRTGAMPPSVEVSGGATVTQPDDPMATGQKFLGWFLNGNKYDFSSPVNSDITLEARWELMIFKVLLPTGNLGYTVDVEPGYDKDKVYYEEDFRFKVTLNESYNQSDLVVKSNDVVLALIDGVYTIDRITSDQTVTVSGVVPNSSKFVIHIPQGEGYAVEVEQGYDATDIPLGGDFKFRLVLEDSYNQSNPVVMVGNTTIQAVSGVYTISDIRTNLTVAVTGVTPNMQFFKVILPQGNGYSIAVESGYDASRVMYGGDFRFKVVLGSSYNQSSPVVKVGNTILTPEGGVYTIGNITSDQTISVTGVVPNPSSGGSGSGGSGGSGSGGTVTPPAPDVKVDPDGTKTTTETGKDGSTTHTVERPDGSTTVTKTEKDGKKTETSTKKDGSSVVKTTEADGSFTEVSTEVDGSKKESTLVKTDNGTIETEKNFDPTGKETGSIEKKTEALDGGIESKTEKVLDDKGKVAIRKNLESADGSLSISIEASVEADKVSLKAQISLDIAPGTEASGAVEKALSLMGSEIEKDVTKGDADASHSLKINSKDTKAVLSAESFGRISDLGMSAAFELDKGTVEFDPGAAKRLSGHKGSVSVSMAHVDSAGLPDVLKEAVGDRPAFEISAGSPDSEIHDLGGTARITVEYELPAGIPASDVRAFYVDDAGVKHMMETVFDELTKKLSFVTPHFSLYVIGSVADVAGSEDDGDEGTSAWVFVAAFAAIAIVAAAVVLLRRKG